MDVALSWGNSAGIVALAAACFAVGYTALRRQIRQALAEQHQATERRLSQLTGEIMVLKAQVAALSQVPAIQTSATSEIEFTDAEGVEDEPEPVAIRQADNLEDEEVPQETMAVLAAAVTAFLGGRVRILSARRLQSPRQFTSPWSQQGRVFVQASHNLRARG